MKRGSFQTATRLLGFAALLAIGPLACERRAAEEADLRWLSLEIDRPGYVPSAPPTFDPPTPDEDGMVRSAVLVPRRSMGWRTVSEVLEEMRASRRKHIDRLPVPTTQEILERFGIHFGPGAFARYEPASSMVVVRQTPEQMELIEAYFSSGGRIEPTVFVRIEIYEVPEPYAAQLLQSTARHRDHSPEHEALIALLGRGEARLMQSTRLISRSGQRSRIEDGYKLSYPLPPGSEEAALASPSSRRAGREMTRTVGTWLEVDPIVGADDLTIDLSLTLEFHTGEPDWPALRPSGEAAANETDGLQPRFRFQTIRFVGEFHSGVPRLVASWRPDGDTSDHGADCRLLLFVQTTRGFPPLPPDP